MFSLTNFITGEVTRRAGSMFEADIEANSEALSRGIEGKSVLVIGGAGSIGSSYIRAVLRFRPRAMVVVDVNENGLTELTRDLRSGGDRMPDDYVTYPMSYADPVFEKMFRSRGGFDIVANFSAHKHVRSEKDVFSVEALLENNVLRAKGLLELLAEFRPERFFCVSTDKAANPVNIMGASKKIMEEMIMSYSGIFPVTTARFANVAFSNGSLPAGFLERLAKGQPISAPSDVTRYFVSPRESGDICMLACILGRSGEIFFPKLERGQVMTFAQIARRFLETQGYRVVECGSEDEARERAADLGPDSKDYPVFFSKSDTTGEKAYEEFYTASEEVDMERFRSLGVVYAGARRPVCEVEEFLESFRSLFARSGVTKADIVAAIGGFLPNFDHCETGRNLDQKM